MAERLFFISYKSEQKDVAYEVKKFIEDQGFLGWLDYSGGLIAGDDWREVIDTAIHESIGVIVLVSNLSMKSPYVTYEWSYAMGVGKRVIPVFLENPKARSLKKNLHPKLEPLQRVEVWNKDSQHWDKLAEAVQSVYEEEHVPLIVVELEKAILQNIFKADDRRLIINALRDTTHKTATELLARLIDLPFPQAVFEASLALAQKTNYTDHRAITGIVEAIKHLGGLQRGALETLVQYDNELAIQAMQSLFECVKENEKNTIADKVDQFETPEVIPLVIKLYREGNRRTAVHNAIEKHRIIDLVPDLITNMQYTTKDREPVYYSNVIRLLGEIRDVSALGALSNVFDSRFHYREDIDAYRETINAIGKIVSKESLEILDNLNNRHPKAAYEFRKELDENILRLKKELGVD